MRQDWDCLKLLKSCLIASTISPAIISPIPSFSQIIPDTSLGQEGSIVTPNIPFNNGVINRIDGGAIRGANLFHSFIEFNVGNNQQVYFANPNNITNIFSRVTGENYSDISGLLGVLGDASLYLFNPNGIILSPNARLDIRGSFAAKTSPGILFNNGYQFTTTNPNAPPLLTVNVPLGISQWLPPTGNITNKGNLSVGQNLSLVGQNIYLEGNLQAGNNLTLKATDTLAIRDSLTNPFIASAGANLLVQGTQFLDIFASTNPQSGFFANGDLTLRSANPIKIDSHYTTGGNLSVEQMDGTPANAFGDLDPIVLAAGDVKLGNYTGVSLHILAGGSVELGNIRINGVGPTDTTINSKNNNIIPGTTTPYSALSNVTLSNGTTTINVNGDTQATLDVRAGIDWNQAPFTGVPGMATPAAFPIGSVTIAPPTLSGSSIKVGKIEIAQSGGLVLLTNQYRPNVALPAGSIQTETILTDKFNIFGFIPPNPDFPLGGDIAIDSRGDISIAPNSKIVSAGLVGGNITLKSDTSLTLNDFARMETFSSTQANGIGGDILLIAPTISLMNKNTVQALYSGRQQSGNIIIQANSLNLNQESQITTSIGGAGLGGKITVNAEAISLNNRSTILAQALGPRGGKAGDVEINTNSLTATQGSQISSATRGVGDAGNVSVIATDSITLMGTSKENPSGIFSFVFTDLSPVIPAFLFPMGIRRGNGNAGVVTIETGNLSVNNGAQIKTSTFGSGNAGIINIDAETIVLDGAVLAPPGFSQPTIPSGILSEIAPSSQGEGREININTGKLSVTNGAFISASTVSKGDAGDINIIASESVSFDGFPGEPFFHSGAYVETKKGATGNAGTLTIITPSLSVTNGATLRALTEGQGDAGAIFVNASDSILLSGAGSGLFSNTTSGSSGDGGDIIIDPELVEIKNGAAISVDSQGSGIGGNISIEADQLRLDNGRISAQTVSTDGGDIKLAVSDLLFLRRGSLISTTAGTAKAGGNGGNMEITAGFIVAFPGENSDITANAFLGNGGNIDVTTQGLLNIAFRPQLTPLNDITVSSEFGLVGDVTFSGLKLDPSSGLVKLPDNLSDPSDQIIVGCAAARGNSFTIAGRGGLPEDPTGTIRGQTLLSDFRDFSSEIQGTNTTPENNQVSVKNSPSRIVEATGWVKDEQGNISLVASLSNEGTAINGGKSPDCN